jgi:hypothetical protein
VDNRLALARSCMERKMYGEAAALYRSCLEGVHTNDPNIRQGLAGALLAAGRFRDAYDLAQALRRSHASFRAAEVQLIEAKALEGGEQFDDALARYKMLAETFAGEEGRWRYGALLARMGRNAEAAEVFNRMLRNAERMPDQYREDQNEWLALARSQMQS